MSDCASNYLRQKYPCACRWFVKSAAVLEAAYEEVEAGRLVDHPKQVTLQKVLTGIVTMQPVNSVTSLCVLCSVSFSGAGR